MFGKNRINILAGEVFNNEFLPLYLNVLICNVYDVFSSTKALIDYHLLTATEHKAHLLYFPFYVLLQKSVNQWIKR